jgi:hypothetical protein
MWITVTRLGVFSPIGRLFSMGSSLENYRSNPYVWATFSVANYLQIVKNGLGYIFGDSTNKASKHNFKLQVTWSSKSELLINSFYIQLLKRR